MRFILTALTLLLCSGTGMTDDSVDLRQLRGWTIVLDEQAIPSEQFAAEEFQSLLQQIAGAKLPIKSHAPAAAKNIFIGAGGVMQTSAVGFNVDGLGDEGLRIRIQSDNIAIAGGRPRGTLYGVYEFMERFLGVRFLTRDHTYIPVKSSWKLSSADFTYIPPFSFRWPYYKENQDYPLHAARLRINTTPNDERYGGTTQQHLISHSLMRYLPAEKYGKEHPEYFALVDGERKIEMWGGGPEPCVTNPDVIEIVAEGVIRDLNAYPNLRNISVSQNDNDAYCHCENCEAINQREGTPMGSHLAFVNAVAERVEKVHPDVKIGTLAYWYTRKPPKTIKPRKNVQIQLCSIECSTLYPLDDPNTILNPEFCEDMDAWGRICDDIWIWNYNTNFHYYDLPFPNLRVISPNIQYFLKNNVKGVFMQCNGNGNSGEMCDLRNYVIAHCLWNPSLNSWDLVDEFCRLHYKKAAQPILDYLTFLHDNAESTGREPGCFPSPIEVGLSKDVSLTIMKYFQRAMKLADTEDVKQRVEKASICAYRAMLETAVNMRLESDALRVSFPAGYEDSIEKYITLCERHNMTRHREHNAFPEYREKLRELAVAKFPVYKLENQYWRLLVLPEENGKIVEMTHKPSGRNLLRSLDGVGLFQLFNVSVIQLLGTQGYTHNDPEAFTVEGDESSLTLTKRLADNSILTHTITLNDNNPNQIEFKTTVKHNGTESKTYQFHVQPQFSIATSKTDWETVTAYVKDDSWKAFNQDWKIDQGPNQDLLNTAQGGGLSVYNHDDDFGIQAEYDPRSIEKIHFWWHPFRELVNLEFYTNSVELEPGASFSFTYHFNYLNEPPK